MLIEVKWPKRATIVARCGECPAAHEFSTMAWSRFHGPWNAVKDWVTSFNFRYYLLVVISFKMIA